MWYNLFVVNGGDDMITITAKLQIFPTPEQQDILRSTMSAYSNACNFVSGHVFETRSLRQRVLNDVLYRDLREHFGLGAQMAQSVIKTVIASYRTILENQGKWIRADFRSPQCDLVWNRDYSLNEDRFSVNTLNGRIKVPFSSKAMEKYFDGSWKFGTAKLVNKFGKWFLHIPVSKDIAELRDQDVCNIVGVDLGMNFLAATYDSSGRSDFYSGRSVKHRRAKYKQVRKQIQSRQTASSRRRLKKIGSRENRWMQDVNHQVSKALVSGASAGTLFVLEDLTGIRAATEEVAREHRYESVNWAYFDLRKKIEYKAQLNGSKTVAVSPKYTSQTCPKCGHTHKLNRDKKNHIFTCRNCGYCSNDDRVGAMNLHRKGIEFLIAVTAE